MLSDLLGTTVARPSQPPRPVRRPTVDVVIGGVPRPTSNEPQPSRPGRPSLASPGRYPIRLPPPPRQNSAFSLPSDSIRPQRQFDVSTVRGAYGEARSRGESATEESIVVSPYYPQSSSWNDQMTGDEDYAADVSQEMPKRNPFSSPVAKRTAEVPTDDNVESNFPKISTSLKTGSSNKDNLEFQTLVAQLNSTLEQLKRQEEEKRRNKRRGTPKPVMREEETEDEGPELIYVNIWNNVGGKLKLTGQKPMLKESFDEMQSKKDFSSLLSPSPPSYFPEPSWQSNYNTGSSISNQYQHGGYRHPEEPRQSGQGGIESRLPLPSSLQGLMPPSPPSQSLWTDISSPLGVGTNSAQPSYKAGQNKGGGSGFLQNPRLVEQPFGQSSYTQRPPNFTPIPLPQVTPLYPRIFVPQALRSSNPSGQSFVQLSTLAATTPSPPSQFQPKHGLKPPSQLAGWIRQLQKPSLHKVISIFFFGEMLVSSYCSNNV